MIDAEIRTLRYVQRVPGGAPPPMIPGAALLPGLTSPSHPPSPSIQESAAREARLELRIRELEREQVERERAAAKALEQVQEQAAHAQTATLQEQQARLDAQWAGRIGAMVEAFTAARDRYFRDVEAEVVRLALSVAARVLHREAQIDPLLLRGPVRVALEELQQQASCVLEVPAETAEAWRRWLSGPDARAAAKVEVRALEDAAPGHLRLEVDASAADLSTGSQLVEIERGFFDLLQHRPGAATAEPRT
jgi:flagellar assembly protein FliH